MPKKVIVQLVIGVIGLLSGILVFRIPAVPEIVSILVAAISGAWIAVVIATKGGTNIRDEMVMRIKYMSGYYAFNSTLYFIFLLAGMRWFSLLTLSISELLLTLMLFMSFSFVLIQFFLMRQGKAE